MLVPDPFAKDSLRRAAAERSRRFVQSTRGVVALCVIDFHDLAKDKQKRLDTPSNELNAAKGRMASTT